MQFFSRESNKISQHKDLKKILDGYLDNGDALNKLISFQISSELRQFPNFNGVTHLLDWLPSSAFDLNLD